MYGYKNFYTPGWPIKGSIKNLFGLGIFFEPVSTGLDRLKKKSSSKKIFNLTLYRPTWRIKVFIAIHVLITAYKTLPSGTLQKSTELYGPLPPRPFCRSLWPFGHKRHWSRLRCRARVQLGQRRLWPNGHKMTKRPWWKWTIKFCGLLQSATWQGLVGCN